MLSNRSVPLSTVLPELASLKTSVMVRVENVDAHYEHARYREMHILRDPTDYPHGERQYSIGNFAGHHWRFTQSIGDVDPSEWEGRLSTFSPLR